VRPSSRNARRQRARRRALQALYQWQITRQGADEILRQFRKAQDLGEVDADYFATLLRGVIAEQANIDRQLAEFLDRPLPQVDAIEQAILRLGCWELLHAPDVPWRVVLDEAIDLAHRFGATQGHAYINAVLDRAARHWRPDEIRAAQPAQTGEA
jgi:N utilization substance protein B